MIQSPPGIDILQRPRHGAVMVMRESVTPASGVGCSVVIGGSVSVTGWSVRCSISVVEIVVFVGGGGD